MKDHSFDRDSLELVVDRAIPGTRGRRTSGTSKYDSMIWALSTESERFGTGIGGGEVIANGLGEARRMRGVGARSIERRLFRLRDPRRLCPMLFMLF